MCDKSMLIDAIVTNTLLAENAILILTRNYLLQPYIESTKVHHRMPQEVFLASVHQTVVLLTSAGWRAEISDI